MHLSEVLDNLDHLVLCFVVFLLQLVNRLSCLLFGLGFRIIVQLSTGFFPFPDSFNSGFRNLLDGCSLCLLLRSDFSLRAEVNMDLPSFGLINHHQLLLSFMSLFLLFFYHLSQRFSEFVVCLHLFLV